jgi:hypothetical protein
MDFTQRRLSLYAVAALIAAMALAFTLSEAVDSPSSALAKKKKKKKCKAGKEKQGCKLASGVRYEGSGPSGRVLMGVESDGVTIQADGSTTCGSNPNTFEGAGMGTSKDRAKVGATLDVEPVVSTSSGLLSGTIKILNATTAKADLTITGAPTSVCPIEISLTLHRE